MMARVSANASWALCSNSRRGQSLRRFAPGILLMWLSGCGGPTTGPEAAVRQWVQDGQQAVEDKDRRSLVDMISPAYTDARGNRRDDIENMLRLHFLRSNKVALVTKIEDLKVIDDSVAELVLSVGMAGTNDTTLGFSADAYHVEMELERAGGSWRLIAARWGGIGDEIR